MMGRTIWGITSPARITSTRSPIRMSLVAIRSSLCSVARDTVTPVICTGCENRVGIERAGAAHVDRDVEQLGLGDFGRELPGDGPARLASADHAELAVQGEAVDFHHHAVGLEVEIGDQRLVALDRALHFVERVEALAVGLDLKAPGSEQVEDVGLRAHIDPAVDDLDRIGEHPEPAAAGDAGIELAERAGGGVARVGEQRFAGFFALLVGSAEAGVGQVDLAPDLHQLGVILAFK